MSQWQLLLKIQQQKQKHIKVFTAFATSLDHSQFTLFAFTTSANHLHASTLGIWFYFTWNNFGVPKIKNSHREMKGIWFNWITLAETSTWHGLGPFERGQDTGSDSDSPVIRCIQRGVTNLSNTQLNWGERGHSLAEHAVSVSVSMYLCICVSVAHMRYSCCCCTLVSSYLSACWRLTWRERHETGTYQLPLLPWTAPQWPSDSFAKSNIYSI